jgi:hypothetical protein
MSIEVGENVKTGYWLKEKDNAESEEECVGK